MIVFTIDNSKSPSSVFRVGERMYKFNGGKFATDDKDVIDYLSNCGYVTFKKDKDVKDKSTNKSKWH